MGSRETMGSLLYALTTCLVWLTFSSACSFEPTTDCGTLSDRQCLALCELYSSAGGAAWKNNTGWGGGSDPASGAWYGVNQDNKGYTSAVSSTAVYSIDIEQNNARGTLPDTLAGLSALAVLECQNNNFSGTIPPSIYQLTALNRLEISANPKLSGTIHNALSQLTSMSRLRFYSCLLSGYIPLGISSLTALGLIQGYDLQVSGHIPDIFSKASSLYYISFTGSETHSHLSGTVEGIVRQFERLSSLSVLYMQQAKFSGTLHSWTANKAVTVMSFSKNRISGVLPIKFSEYSKLRIMNWDSNIGLSGKSPTAAAATLLLLSPTIR